MDGAVFTIAKVLIGAHGRVPRLVYWVAVLISVPGATLGGALAGYDSMWLGLTMSGIATYLYLVVAACRARDMGNSGKFALLTLVPFLGLLIFFQLGFEKSETGVATLPDDYTRSSTETPWHMPVSFLLLLVGSLPVALAFMTLLLGGIRDTNDAVMMTGIGVVGAVIWTTGVLIARRGD